MAAAGFILSQIGAVVVFIVLLAGLGKGVVGLRYQRVQYWQLERLTLSPWEREGAGYALHGLATDDSEDEQKKPAWKKALGIFSRKGAVLLGPVSHRRDTLFLLNGILFFLLPFHYMLVVLRYPLRRCFDSCIQGWPPPDDRMPRPRPRGPHVVTTTSTSMATSPSSISTSTTESAELVGASQAPPPPPPQPPTQPPLPQKPSSTQSVKRSSVVQLERMARIKSRIQLATESSLSEISVQNVTERAQPEIIVRNSTEGPLPKIVVQRATESPPTEIKVQKARETSPSKIMVQNATAAPPKKTTIKRATEAPLSKITAKNPHQYPSFQSHNYNLDTSRQYASHHQEFVEKTHSQNTSQCSADEMSLPSPPISARTRTMTATMKDSSAFTHVNNSTSTTAGSYSSGDRKHRTLTEPLKDSSATTYSQISACIPSSSYVSGDYTPHAQISRSTPSSSYVTADGSAQPQIRTSIPSSIYSSGGRKIIRSEEEIPTSQRSLRLTSNSSPYLSRVNAETITTPVYMQDTATNVSTKRNSSRAQKIDRSDKDSSRTIPAKIPMKNISATTHTNASTSISSNINSSGNQKKDRPAKDSSMSSRISSSCKQDIHRPPKGSSRAISNKIPLKNITTTPHTNASTSISSRISSSCKQKIYRPDKNYSRTIPNTAQIKNPQAIESATGTITSTRNSSGNRRISRPDEETFSNRGTSPISGESWLRLSQDNAQTESHCSSADSKVSIHTMLGQVSPTFSRGPSLNCSQVTRHIETLTPPVPMQNNSSSGGSVNVSIHTITSSSRERDVFHHEDGNNALHESRQFADNPSLHLSQMDPQTKTKTALIKSSCLGTSFRAQSLPAPGKYELTGTGVEATTSGLQDTKQIKFTSSSHSTCLPLCPEDSQSDVTEVEEPTRRSSPRSQHPSSDTPPAQPRRRSRFLAMFHRSDEERRSKKKQRRRRTRSNCAVCRLYASDDRV